MKKGAWLFALALIFGCGFFVSNAKADFTSPEVKVYKGKGQISNSFLAFESAFQGGGFISTGDVNDDGLDEIVIGAGVGGGPRVRVFKKSGKCILDFMAFESTFKGGVDVAIGNIDGIGKEEIIVTKATGGQAWVKVFRGKKQIRNFLALTSLHTGGASVASGDVDSDKKDEIIVGSGLGSRSHVKVFSGRGKESDKIFWPFENSYKGGVDVAVGDYDGGKDEEIAISKARFSNARLKIYKFDQEKTILGQFDAYPTSHQEGANVDAGDIDNDGLDEIITGANGQTSEVRAFKVNGRQLKVSLKPYGNYISGGARVAVGRFIKDVKSERITTIPGKKYYSGRNEYRYIEVSLAKQRLYVYEQGRVVKEMLISSGISKYPTPTGDYFIQAKVLSTRMKHEYGPNHPDNYDIPNVPYAMPFDGGYTIHGAFWHNNFGYPMSHGCVNLSVPDSKWLFEWAYLGESVHVTPW
ncbi:MAG: L,D-transpeptidase [Patescibacteria group bacterium]|jgi:hypothetical protein